MKEKKGTDLFMGKKIIKLQMTDNLWKTILIVI